jgi:hypothetical protein
MHSTNKDIHKDSGFSSWQTISNIVVPHKRRTQVTGKDDEQKGMSSNVHKLSRATTLHN